MINNQSGSKSFMHLQTPLTQSLDPISKNEMHIEDHVEDSYMIGRLQEHRFSKRNLLQSSQKKTLATMDSTAAQSNSSKEVMRKQESNMD